jgi:N-acetyltransferase
VPDSGFRTPVRLTGRYVELVPLSVEHAPELTWAFRDPELRRFLRDPVGRSVEESEEMIQTLLTRQAEGTDLPFATVLRTSGRPIGMTRFLRIDRASRNVEIGGTYLDSTYWRTPVNTESKWLLLRHAESTGSSCKRTAGTSARNEPSSGSEPGPRLG